jgi:hypothetical protein
MKINFTKEHFERLKQLAVEFLFDKEFFVATKLMQPLNTYELLHTTSINQLNEIKSSIIKRIQDLESKDEWVEVDTTKLDKLRTVKEFVNLIIGWKRFTLEQTENERKRLELTNKLNELKESQKTPEDRIKELEAQLKELEDF